MHHDRPAFKIFRHKPRLSRFYLPVPIMMG